MAHLRTWMVSRVNRQSLEHSARTTIAAIASLLVARVFRLPEAYWAAITTLVVMQSTLGAALTISGQRLAGTALGAVAGAFLVTYFGRSVIAFGAGVFVLGLICATLHLDRAAYRFASITLAIIMLVVSDKPAWVTAAHRFIEVSVGIAVALALTALWPEHPPATSASPWHG
jgi:uncharacterized membrane protein YgaE (UPF0421/DUF939 family)